MASGLINVTDGAGSAPLAGGPGHLGIRARPKGGPLEGGPNNKIFCPSISLRLAARYINSLANPLYKRSGFTLKGLNLL